MKLVFDQGTVDLDTLETLRNIRIGLRQTPYNIHKQNCENGCELCRLIRQKEQAYLESLNQECKNQGLDPEKIHQLRSNPNKSNEEDKVFAQIHKLFPNHDEMRLGQGHFSKDVYLIIKLKVGDEASDDLIQKYFGLSSPEFNHFKADSIPGWNLANNREKYTDEQLEAYHRYKAHEELI